MAVRVTIWYVDGRTASFDAGVWPSQRAEGVDRIRVEGPAGPATFSGHSLYWCYPEEGGGYVFGSASPYSPLPPEVVYDGDTMRARPVDYIPDLQHKRVKLGWWRREEARPDG